MFPAGAGHQLDLNHLWQQVQELSSVLAANRESTSGLTSGLIKKADEIRVSLSYPWYSRVLTSGKQSRGGDSILSAVDIPAQTNGDQPSSRPEREHQLAEENSELRRTVAELQAENENLGLLVQDYEGVLERVLEGLRIYAVGYSTGLFAAGWWWKKC
jgi:hypothetical protein